MVVRTTIKNMLVIIFLLSVSAGISASENNITEQDQLLLSSTEVPIEIIDYAPDNDSCSISIMEAQKFHVEANQKCTFEWYVNDVLVQNDSNLSASDFIFDSFNDNSSSSSSLYYDIKTIISNQSETCQKQWTCRIKKKTIFSDQKWELRYGYSLTPSIVDKNGDKVLINLSKNDELVDQRIVSDNSYYYYNRTLNESDRGIIKAYISDIFQGQIDSLIVFQRIEQYSDNGTSDTDPVKLLELEELWHPGDNYSLKAVDVSDDSNSCILLLERAGTTVDKRIVDQNDVYSYERMNEDNNSLATILEIPVLNILSSASGDFLELSNNYILNQDTNTVDTDLLLMIQAGEVWELDNGYSLSVDEISPNNKALITLDKENEIVDRYVIDADSTYNYNRSDTVNDNVLQIVTVYTSKIFDGKYGDYIEFNSDYQVNPDADTVELNERYMIAVGETFELDDGYEVNLVSTDIKGTKAFLSLTLNGKVLDEDIVRRGERYYFNCSIDGNDQVVVSFLLDNVFVGEKNKVAVIRDIVQNPCPIEEINITATEKDVARIRGPIYNGTGLDKIIGPDNSDFIEMNASVFAGFFYDIDKDVSTETLKIFGGEHSNETAIFENGLIYTTQIMPTAYESNSLESYYNIIGFLGEKYVPLEDNTPNRLAKLLVNSDDKIVLNAGETFVLANGYEITAKQIDVEGDRVWMELSKNGDFIEDKIIDVSDRKGETWTCDTDVVDIDDVVVMKMNVTDVVQGYSNGIIIIEGIWLIDFENIMKINVGDTFGSMQVSEIGPNYIMMENNAPIGLTRNSTVGITKSLSFDVDDTEHLSFCIVKETEDTNAHEIRGSVAESPTTTEWTSMNFEGFHYEFDDNTETEKLIVNLSERSIEKGQMAYQTIPASIGFKHEEWGQYKAIGFFGEKYLEGYSCSTVFHKSTTDLLSNGRISRVLIDDDERYVGYTNSILVLDNGYELEVLDINISNRSVIFSLIKDGIEVDTAMAYEDNDYTYIANQTPENNITSIAVHLSDVAEKNGMNSVTIKGIFQVSDECLILSTGERFGQLEITNISTNGIYMENENDVLLSKGTILNITDNLCFRIADDEVVRFYPFMEVTTPSLTFRTLRPSSQNLESEQGIVQKFDTSANKICNLTWIVNGSEVQTNSSCISSSYSFTPASAGLYHVTIVAEISTENIQRTWDLIVTDPSSKDETTKSSGSSSGGGGGGGNTGENYDNILKKEVVSEIVNKDMETSYNFKEKANAVESINFTSLKNAGQVSATIEILKGRSSFADMAPSGEVYQNMNIWIGKTGFATSDNIENVQVRFKVSKTWIEENDIIESSICLCRYNNSAWNSLNTWKVDEDEGHVYFAAETPGFSPFAITGTADDTEKQTNTSFSMPEDADMNTNQSDSGNLSSQDQKSLPGFELASGMTVFGLTALLLRRKRRN